MTTPINRLTLLTPDRHVYNAWKREKQRIHSSISLHLSGSAVKTQAWKMPHNTIIVSHVDTVSHIDNGQLKNVRNKRFILFCSDDFSAENVPDFMSMLKVTNPERIYLKIVRHGVTDVPITTRLLATVSHADGKECILDARLEGKELRVVSSPSFKKLAIPVDTIPSLAKHSVQDLSKFEIDVDGSYIFWPSLNIHLGWDQLLQLSSPEEALKAKQKTDVFNCKYGAAIRQFRKKSNLLQSQIKGMTPRQLHRIETGACRVTSNALEKLASAHGISPNDYMNKIAQFMGK